MRVLILADDFFASRERALLMRLEVGLADEGVRVIHAVPDTRGEQPASVYSRTLTYSSHTLAATRPLAVKRLARAVDALEEREDGIDIVHVFGGASWDFARDLAAELGAALALEVWRAGLIPRARGMGGEADDPPLLMAPDETIERALADGMAGELTVRLAAWGVHAPPAVRSVLPEGRSITAMVVGSGQDAAAFAAALEGLGTVAQERGDLMIFCDAVAARKADLWKHARRLNLLDRLTLIEELEDRRDLLVEGDLLVLPEAKGEQRTVVLEAMAAGMVVVAAKDPMVSVLRDGHTCRLVAGGGPAAWSAAVREILGSPTIAAALARQAHEFVRLHRRASDHVRGVLSAYAWLAGDDAIPFRG